VLVVGVRMMAMNGFGARSGALLTAKKPRHERWALTSIIRPADDRREAGDPRVLAPGPGLRRRV
jgi:hypothetical protein